MNSNKKVFVDDIRRVHKELRKKLRKDSDFTKTWENHCKDVVTLERYAQSMKDLALDVWDEDCDGQNRITWCKVTCMDYFFGEKLSKILVKDKRRSEHFEDEKSFFICGPTPMDEIDCEIHEASYSRFEKDKKISLLDVGSCYDPFHIFEEFSTTPIDLHPANENVIKCDFIKAEIVAHEEYNKHFLDQKSLQFSNSSEKMKTELSDPDSHHKNLNDSQTEVQGDSIADAKSIELSLLPRDFFDVVVFSLLLTYIPCAHTRWKMCEKAHKLLKVNGLLLIVTPDSSHQNRNAGRIKSWKASIELIGFQRIEYHKDTHLHFMAFRKVPQNFLWDRRKVNEMLRDVNPTDLSLDIPQDSHEYQDSDDENKFESTVEDCLDGYAALPQL